MIINDLINCPICERITPKRYWHKHHLVPKSKKGRETVLLCDSCGNMIHQLFTNKELSKKYNTIESLVSSPEVKKWIGWIKKKPNDFEICMASKKKKRK